MIRILLLALLVLAGCTGQNVDEAFLADHGAVLARVFCVCGGTTTPSCGTPVNYWAIMFLDGSVLANGSRNTAFYERGDAARANAIVSLNPEQQTCGAPGAEYYAIENGELNLYTCSGSPASHILDETIDLDDCTGFNKGLFD